MGCDLYPNKAVGEKKPKPIVVEKRRAINNRLH